MASQAKKPRKANGYKMPPPIPSGFVVKNNQKKSWTVGPSIGKGGFGEIYCCCPLDEGSVKSKVSNYPYVMKIEPQANGPLFVEMHFYMKVAKKEDIEKWMSSKGLKSLGMPCYLGSGLFEYNGEKFRFVVLDRYGQDLWSIFLKNKTFSCSTALQIGLQVIDVLEYIHSTGYAHCDIKAANLLLGFQPGTEDQSYLVDFGLATRYTTSDFKPDPKKAHNGTIEYTSRDAHQGVITRRGDMEILGFNLLHWTTSTLPWDKVTDPKVAEEKKNTFMKSISVSAKKMTPPAPAVVINFLEAVAKLKHDQAPDYNAYRKMFRDELKKLGVTSTKLVFAAEKPPTSAKKTPKTPTRKKSTAKAVVATGYDSDVENDDLVENSPEPVVARTTKETKPSWRDCPTAKASNVVRAGEYVSNNPRPKRQRK